MITGKLIDRKLKLAGMLCLSEAALYSKALLLVAVLAVSGALTGCGDAQFVLLTAIQISPANSTIDMGQTQQFTAKGTFSDGTTSGDLTNLVTWSSSNTTVATIGSSGHGLGRAPGTSTISATFVTADGPVTASASLGCRCDLEVADDHPGESVHCQKHKPATYGDRDLFGRNH